MGKVPMLSRIVLALLAGLLLVAATVGHQRGPGCDSTYAAPPGIGSYAAPPCDGRSRS
jgi:hypothetical protein